MAHTSALVDIETIVSRYLLKYKKSTEDAVIYTEHLCNLIRDWRVHDSNQVITEKISVSALGIIEMPDSMITFVDLMLPTDGEYISFTEKDRLVNTTTFTGAIEGQDSHFGEGVTIIQPEDEGYGGRGAINDYNYTIDWETRRIFCNGIISDTVILRYVSSGIELTGATTVPEMITPLADAYLLLKETYWVPTLTRERLMRQKDFEDERCRLRNVINAKSYEEWGDLLMGISSQSPIR